MREAGVFNFEREVWKAANTPLLLIDDAPPAEPFAFIAVGPQRSIARPQPPHFVFGVPIIERRLNSRRQVLRQREGLLIKVFRHFLDKIFLPNPLALSLDFGRHTKRNSARSLMFIARKHREASQNSFRSSIHLARNASPHCTPKEVRKPPSLTWL